MKMASFEHKLVVVSLSFDGKNYQFHCESEKSAGNEMQSMEANGWEFVGFWDNPEVYIKDSYEVEKLPQLKLAIFKRRID